MCGQIQVRRKKFISAVFYSGLNLRGCTRLADMLPSKYEDNALQIKEKSTERAAPFFCTRS
ncbi:hypothetical protein CIJ78_09425, partial [Neisseria meningitidis]